MHLYILAASIVEKRPAAVWNSANIRKQETGSNITSVWDGGIVYVLILHIRKLEIIHFSSAALTANLIDSITCMQWPYL